MSLDDALVIFGPVSKEYKHELAAMTIKDAPVEHVLVVENAQGVADSTQVLSPGTTISPCMLAFLCVATLTGHAPFSEREGRNWANNLVHRYYSLLPEDDQVGRVRPTCIFNTSNSRVTLMFLWQRLPSESCKLYARLLEEAYRTL